MLLKSIKLNNFRQFKGEETVVEFSCDNIKNVTLIIGENSSGKTTLAQAFSWVLYGTTSFNNNTIINYDVLSKVSPGGSHKASVELILVHNGVEYTVLREQIYRKNFAGFTSPDNPVLNISYKQDGQKRFVDKEDNDITIKKIMPIELSKYFFFDGERIEDISKNERAGRQDLANAVKGILGLSALNQALEHMKPGTRSSVIGRYSSDMDSTGDVRIQSYNKDILGKQSEVESIKNRVAEIENQLEVFRNKEKEKESIIREHEDVENKQRKLDQLKKDLKAIYSSKIDTYKDMMRSFNRFGNAYFSKSLMKDSLVTLKDTDLVDKGIPHIHAETIDYLINRGYCICETKINPESKEYKIIEDLRKYIPPESIGTLVRSFSDATAANARSAGDFYDTFKKTFLSCREKQKNIMSIMDEIHRLDEELLNTESVSMIKAEHLEIVNTIKRLSLEKDKLLPEIGKLEENISRLEAKVSEYALIDERNRQIMIYKLYAERIYNEIKEVYEKEEKQTREDLEKSVNNVFNRIYTGKRHVKMDNRYYIDVIVDNLENEELMLDESEGQNVMVSFAFIAGIIDLARKKMKNNDEELKELNFIATEPYPLVMDAPLSKLDKKHIKNVCEVIPEIAEQVIMFIKDTDGEIAEVVMNEKIGKKYVFEKQDSETETLIKGVI